MCRESGRLDDTTMEVENMTVMMSNLMKNLNNDVSVETLMKNFNNDMSIEIFKYLDIFESSSAIDRFFEAWCKASQEGWQTLDFSMLKSDFIKTQVEPFVWVNHGFDNNLYNLLFAALKSNNGNIKNLIFHYNLFLTDDQFMYSAKRCPLVRRLVFVSWNRIKKISIKKAIRGWKDLESMTMPSIRDPKYVFEEISKNCKNFKELKIMGHLHMRFASALTMHLPNLEVLSIRCSCLDMKALVLILDKLQHLQVLNISHSCFVKPGFSVDDRERYIFINDIDLSTIREKASRLCEFFLCEKQTSCIMCHRTRDDCGFPRWFMYEEGIWKDDEVKSLAI
ncbi:unnamed protein product [Lathyrus oleraceus]